MTITINNPADVSSFARMLVREGVSFHPDDDFNSYIDLKSGEPIYTSEEAQIRNGIMETCFTVCERNGIDIYDYMLEIMLIETKMSGIIPLPSSVYAAE